MCVLKLKQKLQEKQKRALPVVLSCLLLFHVVQGTQKDSENSCLNATTKEKYAKHWNYIQTEKQLRLGYNMWKVTELNNHVASILLNEILNIQVEFVLIRDEKDQWKMIEDGQVDVILEVWPSVNQKSFTDYVHSRKIVSYVGNLGVLGQIGWYVPKYAVLQDPFLEYWRRFTDPNVIEQFSHPKKLCDGAKPCTGVLFMGGDRSWAHKEDKIIQGLSLNVSVQWTNESRAIQKDISIESLYLKDIQDMFEKKKYFLFYMWDPHQIFDRFDIVRISLPRTKCDSSVCDYDPEFVYKIMSSRLTNQTSDLVSFFQLFSLSNQDQISMLADVSYFGLTERDVACKWILQNEKKWSDWVSEKYSSACVLNSQADILSRMCSGNGECVDRKCVCFEGFSGRYCDEFIAQDEEKDFTKLFIIMVCVMFFLVSFILIGMRKFYRNNLEFGAINSANDSRLSPSAELVRILLYQIMLHSALIIAELVDIVTDWLVFLTLLKEEMNFWPLYCGLLVVANTVSLNCIHTRFVLLHQVWVERKEGPKSRFSSMDTIRSPFSPSVKGIHPQHPRAQLPRLKRTLRAMNASFVKVIAEDIPMLVFDLYILSTQLQKTNSILSLDTKSSVSLNHDWHMKFMSLLVSVGVSIAALGAHLQSIELFFWLSYQEYSLLQYIQLEDKQVAIVEQEPRKTSILSEGVA